jgi:hypothetical protein
MGARSAIVYRDAQVAMTSPGTPAPARAIESEPGQGPTAAELPLRLPAAALKVAPEPADLYSIQQ